MKRRTFVLGALGAARLASGRERTDGLIGALRAGGGWASRLDDPAYGGRGDGTTLNDGPLLQALTDMPPEGGTLVIPPAGSWLFDAVDLAQVPRSGVVLVATGAQLVKATRTNTHMFRDEVGRSPGLTVVGGTFDLSAASFQPGDTVSAFFMVRSDDITFVDVTVRDGIEEGLKLYKPRRLRVRGGRFERLVNNGIQIHAPGTDGFKGNAPDRNSEDVVVEGVAFQSVDDGLHGMEGQGVSVSADSPDTTAQRVRVLDCTFDRCVRGAWAEFNHPGMPGLDIRFDRNQMTAAECHGLGMVGVRGGGLQGNRVLDTGSMIPGTPGTAASEVAGLVLSGSAETYGEELVVEDNEIVERHAGAAARMQYGILVRRQAGLTLRRNVVRGATIRPLEMDAQTVRGKSIDAPI